MRIIALRPRSGLRAAGALALGLSLTACSFNPYDNSDPDELLPFRDGTPFSAPTSTDRALVFEQPGVFAAYHGTTCAVSNRSGEEIALRVQEELPLPKGLDRGTVLLNGFRLKYLDEDHHVKGLGTGIGAIELVDGTLRWEAGGVLSDHNFDDGYEWCYTFTALAWSSMELQATVSHGDTNHAFRNLPWTDGTALEPVPGFLENPAWVGLPEVAVLPRGFALIWNGEDHHVLQIAYEHDAGDVYIEKKKEYGNGNVPVSFSQAGTGFVSWESIGFLKDNDTRRDQYVLDLVSGLGGPDVDLISPPFSVAPREDAGVGCGSLGGIEHSEDHMVFGVPFEFAVPVLGGWDLAYVCDDEHVTEVGAAIPSWSWEPGPAGGILRYTVATQLRDKDAFPDFYDHTQVKILGFRRITPQKPR